MSLSAGKGEMMMGSAACHPQGSEGWIWSWEAARNNWHTQFKEILDSSTCTILITSSYLPVCCYFCCKRLCAGRSVVSVSLQPHRLVLQAPLSMEFPRQECRSGLPFPSPGNLPDLGIEPRCPALQADSLSSEPCWTALLQYPNLNTRSCTEVLKVQSGDCWPSLRSFHRAGEV